MLVVVSLLSRLALENVSESQVKALLGTPAGSIGLGCNFKFRCLFTHARFSSQPRAVLG